MSFFSKKKKPAPTGEEEGRMGPAATESVVYFSMASRSGLDRLKSLLVGRGAPGSRSMAQSYSQWGGSKEAEVLQKTCCRSW